MCMYKVKCLQCAGEYEMCMYKVKCLQCGMCAVSVLYVSKDAVQVNMVSRYSVCVLFTVLNIFTLPFNMAYYKHHFEIHSRPFI